jgi:hypothetical protein
MGPWRRNKGPAAPLDAEASAIRDELLRRRDELAALSIARPSRPYPVRQLDALGQDYRRYVLGIRETKAGRAAMKSLLSHQPQDLQFGAALEVMVWNPELALPVIKEIARRDIVARIWLKKHEAGEWDPDWETKQVPRRQVRAAGAYRARPKDSSTPWWPCTPRQ